MAKSAVTRPEGMHPDALPPDFDDWDKEPSVPDHPLGTIHAIDYDTGLPIIKRKPSSQPAQKAPEETAAEPEPAKPAPEPKLQPATLEKGQPVTLPDGSKGQVAHVIDGKSARVRTEAGKNVVMKQADLTPHILVKSHYRKLPK